MSVYELSTGGNVWKKCLEFLEFSGLLLLLWHESHVGRTLLKELSWGLQYLQCFSPLSSVHSVKSIKFSEQTNLHCLCAADAPSWSQSGCCSPLQVQSLSPHRNWHNYSCINLLLTDTDWRGLWMFDKCNKTQTS